MTTTHGRGASGRQEYSTAPKKFTRNELREQIALAKLRVITDRKLQKQTPDWVQKLADKKL